MRTGADCLVEAVASGGSVSSDGDEQQVSSKEPSSAKPSQQARPHPGSSAEHSHMPETLVQTSTGPVRNEIATSELINERNISLIRMLGFRSLRVNPRCSAVTSFHRQ